MHGQDTRLYICPKYEYFFRRIKDNNQLSAIGTTAFNFYMKYSTNILEVTIASEVLPYIRRTVASNTFSFEPAVDLQIY